MKTAFHRGGIAVLASLGLASTFVQADTLYFKSSFGGSVTSGYKQFSEEPWAFDLWGYDYSAGGVNHTWEGRLNGEYTSPEGAKIGDHRINVEDWNKNKVSIEDWGGNKVLKFYLPYVTDESGTEPNKHRGRVQTELARNINWREFHYTVKCYLPTSSIDKLRTLPGSWGGQYCWFTLAEFFSQSSDRTDQSRLGLVIKRDDSDKTLFFKVVADEGPGWSHVWDTESNTRIGVPLNKWFTIDVYIKWGGAANSSNPGRVYISIQPDGGERQVICNVKGPTHHRNLLSANTNRGYTMFFPMKLYTNRAIIDYARNSGWPLSVYWDQFNLWYGAYTTNPPSNLNTGVISK